MRRVIVESPYAGDRDRNHAYLLDCLRDCYARGEAPIASHAMGPLVLDDDNAAQREKGIAAGLAWHAVADAVVLYRDLGVSPGMAQAADRARQLGVSIESRFLPGWKSGIMNPVPTSPELVLDPHPREVTCSRCGIGCLEHRLPDVVCLTCVCQELRAARVERDKERESYDILKGEMGRVLAEQDALRTRAEAAERERAARIAETTCSAAKAGDGSCCSWSHAQRAIAAAIRGEGDCEWCQRTEASEVSNAG